jgi:NAD-dependent DNA ligase
MEKIKILSLKELEKYFKKEDLTILHELKLELDDLYYNTGESSIEDSKYDLLKNILKQRDSNYKLTIGAKLREGENRVELPFWLGSLEKITPDEIDVLERWKKENPSSDYVIAEKLDGVSCLLVSEEDNISLYTRGDGRVGANISYLLPYFHTIPKKLGNISVRGELIIKKSIFEQRYKGQVINGKIYKNARNMVSGLVNAKTSRKGLEDIDFVTYEIVGNETMPKPSKQFSSLEDLGFSVAKHEKISFLSIEELSKLFLRYKEESEYEIDGIVVYANEKYDRNTSGNPSYMFAFKMLLGDSVKKTVVEKVEWNVSKWGQLKPVVIVSPVDIGGVTINRATAYHGKYIEDNKLGPGAVVKITRSKEVIPYIVDVIIGANEAQMPEDYTWDKNHVNIIVGKRDIGKVKEMESNMCIKLISSFFAKLGIKHVSEATVSKMYVDGLDNVLKILEANKQRLLEVPGFQEKSAERIYTNIHNGMKNVKLPTLLGASGIFGFGIGIKRMEILFLDIPNLMEIYKKRTKKELLTMVMNVEGFSEIMAQHIVNNISYANLLVEKMRKYMTFKTDIRVSSDMTGHKYVMTGFRDKKLEEDISQRGGKVVGTVSKNTTALIVKQKTEKLTGKLERANEFGVPIYGKDEFIARFISNI